VLRLTLKSSDLIYLEASDNYVIIHFQAGSAVKSYLLRNTLKRLELVLDGFPLLRCHRSYMVNMHRVKMLKRDKGKFKLWMDEDGRIAIPVSRSYNPAVTDAFENVLDIV
jgi:DNA-binding LytR/AlgR family response regulator